MEKLSLSREFADVAHRIGELAPAGSVVPFAGTTAPAGWLLCHGQAISRETYSSLFAAIGTTYGAGDGSTTFNLPDLRGRVAAGKDDMGGSAAGRLTAAVSGVPNGATLGAAAGAQSHTLAAAESGMPAHGHTASSSFSSGVAQSAGAHTHTYQYSTLNDNGGGTPSFNSLGTQNNVSSGPVSSAGAHTHTVTGSVSTAVNNAAAVNASQAHNNVQPTIVLNYIIKT